MRSEYKLAIDNAYRIKNSVLIIVKPIQIFEQVVVLIATNDPNLELIGSVGVVLIEPSGLSVTGRRTGRPKRRLARTPNAMVPVLDSVVASAPEKTQGPVSRAADHLETLAVIEAAYLSARTGEVEIPARFLDQD